MDLFEFIGKVLQWSMIVFCVLCAIVFTISLFMGNCPFWCWLLLVPMLLLGAWIAYVEEW